MIFLASRSLIRKLPSLRGTRPQGASRSEAISRTRGSPRDATPLELGRVDGELEGGDVLAAVGAAVRVSALGSLAAFEQLVASSNAPHAAANRRGIHRRPACAAVRITPTVWPPYSGRSRPQIRRVQDLDRLRLTDQLDLGDAGPAVGVQHQLTRITDKGDCRRATHSSNGLWRSVFGGGAEALEYNPDLDSAEPCPAQELEPPPHPLLDVVAELPGGLRGIPSPAHVFMVDEELGGIRSFVDAWNREDGESRRTSPNPIDELWSTPIVA